MGGDTVKLGGGFVIGGTPYTLVTLREVRVREMLAAERDAVQAGGGVHTPLGYAAALLAHQIVRAAPEEGGNPFEGPFTLSMIEKLTPEDFRCLRDGQAELDRLGESGPDGSGTLSTRSS